MRSLRMVVLSVGMLGACMDHSGHEDSLDAGDSGGESNAGSNVGGANLGGSSFGGVNAGGGGHGGEGAQTVGGQGGDGDLPDGGGVESLDASGGSAPLGDASVADASDAMAPELPDGHGWIELPNTVIEPVCACNDGFPELCANSGCSGIFAWSSGAYDSQRGRMLVFGGGHSDYFGNEIFGLPLSGGAMERITDPGPPPSDDCSGTALGGTEPSSRHTYDSLLYLKHVDRLFFFGGSKTPCGYLANDTWTYSFASLEWEPRAPLGPVPNAVPGIVADYDPVTQKVFLHDDSRLFSYDVDADRFELLLESETIDYHMTAVIDPVRRNFVVVGAGAVYSFDLTPGSGYARSILSTTGGDAIVDSGYPGLAYDPAHGGRIVAWNGGNAVYALDLESGSWSNIGAPGGPGDANQTGTYKRWRHVDGTDAFILINAVNQNAYLFRP